MSLIDEFLSDRTEEVSLAAAGISERQNIFVPAEECAFHQAGDLHIHRPRKTIPFELCEALI